jgi:hypothetical protein
MHHPLHHRCEAEQLGAPSLALLVQLAVSEKDHETVVLWLAEGRLMAAAEDRPPEDRRMPEDRPQEDRRMPGDLPLAPTMAGEDLQAVQTHDRHLRDADPA